MNKMAAIALTTWRELMRGKVLYLVLFFAVILVLAAALFGSVTIGDQILVIKDFGLFSISLFSVVFTVIAGASLLHKELSKKTIYNILSKPVERAQFLWGKFLGILAATSVLIAALGAALIIFVFVLSGQLDGFLALACVYIFLEAVIICAASIFFSSLVVTPLLSGLFTLGVFLTGRSLDYMLYFVREGSVSPQLTYVLRFLHAILPNLARLNVMNDIVFRDPVSLSPAHLAWSGLYAISYAGVLMILSSLIFKRREFN